MKFILISDANGFKYFSALLCRTQRKILASKLAHIAMRTLVIVESVKDRQEPRDQY